MNQSVIEAQAHYLIEDRIRTAHRTTHRTQAAHIRRHHRRLRTSGWL